MKNSGIVCLRGVYIGRKFFNMKNVAEIFNVKDEEFLDSCDLILAYNDFNRLIDNYILLAVKLNHIDDKADFKEELKSSIRHVDSLIKLYNIGFDATCIWHYFERKVEEDNIRRFCSSIDRYIEKMKLPEPLLLNVIRDEKRLPIQYMDEKILKHREKLKNLLELSNSHFTDPPI
ncbi:MAG: hypothetical protein NDF56_05695 [archaeon GB-1845-036]|nr:hypothetical protein [Candidatus Culexmicrobium thermophilum]RLE55883.1 MAG: hypothetical protein DRJ30_03170 [Candidatus Verstraetearchaeota archaeon]HDO21194.1 hypothetical protein [Candidatus Bathyarchaeota archaeon]